VVEVADRDDHPAGVVQQCALAALLAAPQSVELPLPLPPLALGKIGTDQARRALQAAGGEDDAVVRSAVNRALRGEESA